MNIGEKIKKRRQQLNLTLDEVATAIGVTKSAVSKWERGEVATIRQKTIAKLSAILQVSPLYLIYEDEELEKPIDDIDIALNKLTRQMNIYQKSKLLSYAVDLIKTEEK